MKTPIPCTFLIAAALSVVVGCSSSDSAPANGNKDSSSNSNNGNSGQILAKYNGAFTSSCEPSDGTIPLVGSTIVTTTVNDDSGSIRAYNYVDDSCTIPGSPAELLAEVSISYPGGTVDTPKGEADFVNLSPESITIDGRQPTDVERQLLTGAGVGAKIYDIFLIDGAKLYLGDRVSGRDGTTAEKRPNTLRSEPYNLQ